MQELSGGPEVSLCLSDKELVIVIAGLRETLELLEDWEFQTRTGCEREEMRRLLGELLAIADRRTRTESDANP